MSQAASAARSEKDATPDPKLRSCVVCRNRKVRCDKQSPCSNCRRANIACVFPATDRPPRWARRLERLANTAAAPGASSDMSIVAVADRLHHLEDLVQELRGQLEHAQGVVGSTRDNFPEINSRSRDALHHTNPPPPANDFSSAYNFGRLVLQDVSHSRYVSSPFWSRVNDEVRDTREDDSDGSEETSPRQAPSCEELGRTHSERHAFLFRHNLSLATPDLREFHPLPSQIPFLVEVFSENVNVLLRVVHIPTVTAMVRDLCRNGMMLTPSNEALIFSIYYAAVASMDEEDATTSFGAPKAHLMLKYRLGLEHALSKADFLNAPDTVLIQAFTLFLVLARRHDNPRFVWMMTGLLVRMAHYLGLQREGTHFEHLTPFEIELRRKVWWAVCWVDVRAAEDQGTDLAIASGSFDTKIPLNINDVDINPEMPEMPTERYGVTDNSFARITARVIEIHRQLMAAGAEHDLAGLDDKNRLLSEVYLKFEQEYLQFSTETNNVAYWVSVTVARLVMAKLTLLVFLPVLFSSPSEHLSDEIRTKLLVAAIEVAEYNHALNAERACRHWHWLFQTRTHWHAVVYLLIDISRRPWSPLVERAWVALHSSWLIPAQPAREKTSRIWVPLRKLMERGRKHRAAELNRLRADSQAVARLQDEYQQTPQPSSSGPFSKETAVEIFRERWLKLLTLPEAPGDDTQASEAVGMEPPPNPSVHPSPVAQSRLSMSFEPARLDMGEQQADPVLTTDRAHQLASEQAAGPSLHSFSMSPADWLDGRALEPNCSNWLWADTDFSTSVSNLEVETRMDLDGNVDWYNWVKNVKGIESGKN